jgi:hypothetical protein
MEKGMNLHLWGEKFKTYNCGFHYSNNNLKLRVMIIITRHLNFKFELNVFFSV